VKVYAAYLLSWNFDGAKMELLSRGQFRWIDRYLSHNKKDVIHWHYSLRITVQ